MKAAKTVNEDALSRSHRDGKLSALCECLGFITDEGLTGEPLRRRIEDLILALFPPAYATYCARFKEALSCGAPSAVEPILKYDKWRSLTAAAREEAQLYEILDAEPAGRYAQMRRSLLLADGEPPDDEAERQERDGGIDGCAAVARLMDREKLDGQALGDRIRRLIFDAWPADYVEYRQRHQAFFSDRPSPADIGPLLTYAAWRDAVDEMQTEAAKCDAQGGGPSSRLARLSNLLLRMPWERAPDAD